MMGIFRDLHSISVSQQLAATALQDQATFLSRLAAHSERQTSVLTEMSSDVRLIGKLLSEEVTRYRPQPRASNGQYIKEPTA